MASVHGLRWASTILLIRRWSHARMLGHATVVWVSHRLRWLLLLRLRRLLLSLYGSGSGSTSLLTSSPLGVAAAAFFTRYNVDEKIEHVTFRECGSDVATLQGATFVVLRMYPGTHCQLGDENVASLGKKNRCFGGDHLYLRIGLHHLLYAGKGQLVDFEVVRVGFEVVDCILPVGGQNVTRWASEALIYLETGISAARDPAMENSVNVRLSIILGIVLCVGRSLALRATTAR
jgi:hypothetical protein